LVPTEPGVGLHGPLRPPEEEVAPAEGEATQVVRQVAALGPEPAAERSALPAHSVHSAHDASAARDDVDGVDDEAVAGRSEPGSKRTIALLGAVLAACVLAAWLLWPRRPELPPGPRLATSTTATEPVRTAVAPSIPPPSAVPAPSQPAPGPPVAVVHSAAPHTTLTAKPPARPPKVAPAAPGERDDDPKGDAETAARRRLEAKANAGKASGGELLQLLDLCAKLADTACLERVRGQLNQRPGDP
jgi:hypothetical protein